jgi:hypothetical protein
VERTQIFFEFDLDEYAILAALLINGKDFCGDGNHFGSLSTSDFAGDGTRLKLRVRRGIGGGERVGDTRAFQCRSRTNFAMRPSAGTPT